MIHQYHMCLSMIKIKDYPVDNHCKDTKQDVVFNKADL